MPCFDEVVAVAMLWFDSWKTVSLILSSGAKVTANITAYYDALFSNLGFVSGYPPPPHNKM